MRPSLETARGRRLTRRLRLHHPPTTPANRRQLLYIDLRLDNHNRKHLVAIDLKLGPFHLKYKGQKDLDPKFEAGEDLTSNLDRSQGKRLRSLAT